MAAEIILSAVRFVEALMLNAQEFWGILKFKKKKVLLRAFAELRQYLINKYSAAAFAN